MKARLEMREMSDADIEIRHKIKELQLFVNDKMVKGEVSDMKRTQCLIDDIQLINHIWQKDDEEL